ncbi:restriction endonuclease subunit S [Salmonella enterica]|uniref:Type I restriction endonuclease subunit S n=1 Tax=Salmonella enterica subsp. diarizonae serovar 48:i:z TaxID=1192842 RepID=A0A7U6BGB8_SALDZ|nr:restriction endonuclease subunit S [Salmonella enterica]EAA4451666.1 type I restriction endonuclease subunit S [Salmonella enterica subsp. diarizonae]EDW6117134.1 type I restriction endonuclease subunit S [Salmonella enterica subsp. salamae]AXC74205.1 type I restriction endonuclease subunit S [Salmonella enterica subsp. diarizonae serovar 48:i:z]EAM6406226.1 type I restriction endonuclease subunit S [Salmonella enterica]EAN2412857.1 type I restriction endonuclease subunit S [Salmonella ente
MSGEKLPEGWVESELSALGHIVTGKTPSTKEPANFGGDIPFIKPGDLDLGGYITATADTLTEKGLALVPTLPTNSIVVTCIGNLGKVGITTIRSASNQQINALIPSKKLNIKFIYYQILTLKPWLESQSAATTIAIVNKSKFSQAPFKFPPTSEQKIIAEKLDTLLAQVDSTKARLKQIPQILKRFRQAVLAAAASGRLTNKWRENYTLKEEINLIASKYKPTDSLFKQAKLSLPEIPQSWYVVPSAHLIDYVTSGSRGWANYYSTEGALFLRMSNVRYNTTRLDLQDLQFVNLPGHVEGKRSLVKIDDLIISLTADVGRVARIDKDLGEAYINQHLALLRPNNNINSEYFALSIAAQNIGVKQIQSLKRGATKVGLGLDDIRSLAIPLPSLEEQHEIVRRVEQLFAWADTIEKQVNNALTRVNNLTQSILAKAFRGELTAQWRAENPDLISGENSAAALLEKIKAERATSDGKKTSRKKS